VAFSTYVWLLHHVRPALVSSYAYVNPAIAVALGAWLAGERFTAHDLGAMAVILAGVVTITLARVMRRCAPRPRPPRLTAAAWRSPPAPLSCGAWCRCTGTC